MDRETSEQTYGITQLDPGQLTGLEELYTIVHGHPPANGYFSKKYDTAYTGVGHLGYMARNREGVVIAFYGVIPCFIRYNNEVILAAQSVDAMTHPSYRHKGLFLTLSGMTLDLLGSAASGWFLVFPTRIPIPG